jgi:hypothetical protein
MIYKLFYDLLIGVLSAYLFILSVKIYYWILLQRFRGIYFQLDDNKTNPEAYFRVCVIFNIRPASNLTIKIKRIENNNSDWKGKFEGDILNPYFFKGFYQIENRDIAGEPGKDADGWMDLNFQYLTAQNKMRIGIQLHYVVMVNQEIAKDVWKDQKQWKDQDGYYIEKVLCK